jgi:hypothetical protein
MAGGKKKRDKNSKKKPAEPRQPNSIKNAVLYGWFGTHTVQIERAVTICCGVLAIISSLTGHPYFSLWLFAIVVLGVCVALITHPQTRTRLPLFLANHRGILCSALAALIFCGALHIHRAWATAEIYSYLVPGTGPMPWEPRFVIDAPPEEDLSKAKATGDYPITDEIPDSAIRLYLGPLMTWTAKFPYTAIAQGTENMIMLDRSRNSGVVLDAKIFDREGTVICDIINNDITANSDKCFHIDRTPNSVAVFDKQDNKVLAVTFINPHAIQISGDFYLRNGYRVQLGEGEGGTAMRFARGENPVGIWINRPLGATRGCALSWDSPNGLGIRPLTLDEIRESAAENDPRADTVPAASSSK